MNLHRVPSSQWELLLEITSIWMTYICIYVYMQTKHLITEHLLFLLSYELPSQVWSSRLRSHSLAQDGLWASMVLLAPGSHILWGSKHDKFKICFCPANILYLFNLIFRSNKKPRRVEGKIFLLNRFDEDF